MTPASRKGKCIDFQFRNLLTLFGTCSAGTLNIQSCIILFMNDPEYKSRKQYYWNKEIMLTGCIYLNIVFGWNPTKRSLGSGFFEKNNENSWSVSEHKWPKILSTLGDSQGLHKLLWAIFIPHYMYMCSYPYICTCTGVVTTLWQNVAMQIKLISDRPHLTNFIRPKLILIVLFYFVWYVWHKQHLYTCTILLTKCQEIFSSGKMLWIYKMM